MIFTKLTSTINSEGDIVSLLKCNEGNTYVSGRTDNGKSTIICRTNQFNIKLYITSRITLKELYLLSQDTHYYVISNAISVAKFFEITTENTEPIELSSLECGNDLYHMIPISMRSQLSTNEILELLPNPISTETKQEIEEFNIQSPGIDFFNPENNQIRIGTIDCDIINEDDYEYIFASTLEGKQQLATRVTPHSLFLLINNRISIKDVFNCQQDGFFYIIEGKSTHQSEYTDEVKSILNNLQYADLTYNYLPKEIQIENNPIEMYKYYVNNITISGLGVLRSGFRATYPVDIKIENRIAYGERK